MIWIDKLDVIIACLGERAFDMHGQTRLGAPTK